MDGRQVRHSWYDIPPLYNNSMKDIILPHRSPTFILLWIPRIAFYPLHTLIALGEVIHESGPRWYWGTKVIESVKKCQNGYHRRKRHLTLKRRATPGEERWGRASRMETLLDGDWQRSPVVAALDVFCLTHRVTQTPFPRARSDSQMPPSWATNSIAVRCGIRRYVFGSADLMAKNTSNLRHSPSNLQRPGS